MNHIFNRFKLYRFVSLCSVLFFVCCHASKSNKTQQGELTVVDDLGQQIFLAKPAHRIAALSPSNVEILLSVGCGKSVILRDNSPAYHSDMRKIPQTDAFRLSPEHIAGFQPDLVLLSHADASHVAALNAIGLVVGSFDPRVVEQVYRNIVAVGTLCGEKEQALNLVQNMRDQVANVHESIKGLPSPKVYVEIDGADPLKPWTAGPGSFVDQLITLGGGHNIASGIGRPYAQISVEDLLSYQPDFIVLTTNYFGDGLKALLKRPGWDALYAVKKKQVISGIDGYLLTRPGPRLIEALKALAQALHPRMNE